MPLTIFCPALRSRLFVFLICVLLAKMDCSFDANQPYNDLSTAFSTETLTKGAMIPEGFANTPSSRTDMPVGVIGGGRYLRVDQALICALIRSLNPIESWNSNKTVYRTVLTHPQTDPVG